MQYTVSAESAKSNACRDRSFDNLADAGAFFEELLSGPYINVSLTRGEEVLKSEANHD